MRKIKIKTALITGGLALITTISPIVTISCSKKTTGDLSIELNKYNTKIEKNESFQLIATVTGDGDDKGVIWESGDENIVFVDQNGLISAGPSALGGTWTTITAKLHANPDIKKECIVTVFQPVTNIFFPAFEPDPEHPEDNPKARVNLRSSFNLGTQVSPSDANDKGITYTTSDASIATVDSTGKVTAKSKIGTAIITATANDKSGSKAILEVDVEQLPSGFALDKSSIGFFTDQIGDQELLIPTFTPSDVTDKSIVWTSSDESVATVADSGEGYGIVTLKGSGTATITATPNAFPDLAKTCTINTIDLPLSDALCFTSKEEGSTIGWKWVGDDKPTIFDVQYSYNGSNWSSWNSETVLTLNTDEKVYVRKSGANLSSSGSTDDPNYFNFVMDNGSFDASGNVYSLIGCQQLTANCFHHLFYNCRGLKTVPKMHPDASIKNSCYNSMYAGCTGLTNVPTNLLPNYFVASNCYQDMFNGCTNLTNVPNLPCPNGLWIACYYGMFGNCSSLTTVPENLLPSSRLSTSVYCFMFSECVKLTNAPKLMGEYSKSCYSAMFQNCRSLRTVPQMSSTAKASWCCYNMFCGCNSLNKITSVISSTDLATGCYSHMFYNCYNLKIKENDDTSATLIFTCPEDIPDDAINSMFGGTGGTFKGTPTPGNSYYVY